MHKGDKSRHDAYSNHYFEVNIVKIGMFIHPVLKLHPSVL